MILIGTLTSLFRVGMKEPLLPVPSALPIALLPGIKDRTNSSKHATISKTSGPWVRGKILVNIDEIDTETRGILYIF